MWFILQHSLPCAPHNSSIGVAALGFPWYRSFHPDPRKKSSTADEWWPHHRSDTASLPSVFLCWWTEYSQMIHWCQIRRIWRVINQFKSHGHGTAAIATTDLSAVALSWWNRTPFVSFPGRFETSTTFQFLNYLSNVGLSRRKQCT